jgi:tetratricopeptide (TPR) repeat protein
MDPDFAQAHFDIGQVYVQQARYEDALAAFNKARSVSMVRARGAQAHALAISGRKDEARGILHELKQLSQLKYVSPYDIAVIYVGLGEKDRALAWLQKALDDGSPGMMLLKVEPVFDSLRSDPRFIALLKKMGLPS